VYPEKSEVSSLPLSVNSVTFQVPFTTTLLGLSRLREQDTVKIRKLMAVTANFDFIKIVWS
jgi:hypothetical protein